MAPSPSGEGVAAAPPQEARPLRRFRVELSFDGTEYHGWQVQPNGLTVQEVLESCLSKLFGGCRIRVQGSSRTDSGVHALGLVASFDAPESPYIPDWKVKKAMNRLLPPSIKIREAELAPDSFNARFSAHAKAYVYVINTGDLNPFTCRWSWHLRSFTRLDEVAAALKLLEGTHDFSSFAVERSGIDDPVRTIFRAELKTFGPLVCLHFIGDGFLYKMVRSMAGALADVGLGRMEPDEMSRILEARDRCMARDTAPAHGLFLVKVFYKPGEWEGHRLEQPPFWML